MLPRIWLNLCGNSAEQPYQCNRLRNPAVREFHCEKSKFRMTLVPMKWALATQNKVGKFWKWISLWVRKTWFGLCVCALWLVMNGPCSVCTLLELYSLTRAFDPIKAHIQSRSFVSSARECLALFDLFIQLQCGNQHMPLPVQQQFLRVSTIFDR